MRIKHKIRDKTQSSKGSCREIFLEIKYYGKENQNLKFSVGGRT